MNTYLLQPLKLQLRSSYKFYLTNYILELILFIVSSLLDRAIFVIIIFIVELLFSLTMGLINNMVNGNTYYSLKHDRKPFILSSIILNLINSFIISLIFIVPMIILTKSVNIFGLITTLILMFTSFSIGSTYAIFLENKRIVNIIVIMILFAILIIFGSLLSEGLLCLISAILNFSVSDYDPNYGQLLLNTILFSGIISIVLNVISAIKYMHKN